MEISQKQIFTLRDLSLYLSTSESAIRSRIHKRDYPGSLPVPYKLGARWYWNRRDVDAWVELKAKAAQASLDAQKQNRKPGRPRKFCP